MIAKGVMSLEEIAQYTDLPLEDLQKLKPDPPEK